MTKVTFDENTRTIKFNLGVTSINFQTDVYSDGKDAWLVDGDLSKFKFPIRTIGGNLLPSGKIIEPTFFLQYGWQLEPANENGSVTIYGNIFHDDGIPVVKTPGGYTIVVNMSTTISPDTVNPQVVKRSSEDMMYNGSVFISTGSLYSGTEYPIGTFSYPVNNLTDGKSIALARGFKTIKIISDLTITSGEDISNFTIKSDNWAIVTLEDTVTCDETTFEKISFYGKLSGGWNVFLDCWVYNATNFAGWMRRGSFEQIALAPYNDYSMGQSFFDDILPMYPHVSSVLISNTNVAVSFTGANDSYEIHSLTEGSTLDMGFNSGELTLDSSCIGGTVFITGVGVLKDNSTSLTSLNTDGLMNKQTITEVTWDIIHINTIEGIPGIVFPIGTPGNPVNNLADAILIGEKQKIKEFHVIGNITLTQPFEGYSFESVSPDTCIINMNGQNVYNSKFSKLNLIGNSINRFSAIDCKIESNESLNANLNHVELGGGFFTLESGCTLSTSDCSAGENAIFNLNGNGNIAFQKADGLFTFINATYAGCTIGLTGNYIVTLDSSCTSGVALLGGIGMVTNNSNMYVINKTLPSAIWDELITDHQTIGTTGKALNDSGRAGNPWASNIEGNTDPGTFGEKVNKLKNSSFIIDGEIII